MKNIKDRVAASSIVYSGTAWSELVPKTGVKRLEKMEKTEHAMINGPESKRIYGCVTVSLAV